MNPHDSPFDSLKIGPQEQPSSEPQRSHGQSLNNDVARTSRATYRSDGDVLFQQEGTMSANTRDIPTGSDVFIAARSENGRQQTLSTITDDSVVTLRNGMEAKLSTLLNAGLVERRPDGTYAEGAGETQTQYDGEDHEDLQGEFLADPNVERALGEFYGKTDPGTQISALNSYAETGEISERVLGQLASQAGMEPHQVLETWEPIRAQFEQQARDTVEKATGLSADDVFAWAHEHEPKALQQAMKDHGTKRTTRAYEEIAQKYVRTLDKHDPQAILSAELGEGVASIHQDKAGNVVLTDTEGRSFSWASAVRAGIVNVGSAR